MAAPQIKWSHDANVRREQAKHGPGWKPAPKRNAVARKHGAAQALGAPRQKTWTEMGPGELKHFATKTVQQATKTELSPFKLKGQELAGQEGATQARYGAGADAANTLLGQIQGEANTSAKTFQNSVAENALKASKGVETSGQALADQSGGYTDPVLRNQLAAEKANVTGIGASSEAAAGQLGQNEANYMNNLRAAAAQRVTEGHQAIAGTFGKQKAEVGAKESELLAKQPERITKLFTELGQKQFNNQATEAGLGIKKGTLQQKESAQRQKGQEGSASRAQKEAASRRSAAVQERGQNIQKWAKEADRTYKETHPAGSKSKAPKAPSPAEGRKFEKEVSRAEQIAREHLGSAKYNHGRQEEVRKYLSNAYGANGDLVSAALNLAVYGKLGPQDRKTAEAYGLTKAMRKQWFS